MKKVILLAIIAIAFTSCQSRSGRLKELNDAKEWARIKAEQDAQLKERSMVVRFNGKDSQMPKDGQLLVVKVTLGDTVIVEPASLDDACRVLEENGKG